MVYTYAANINNLPDPIADPECMEDLPEYRKKKILRYKQKNDRIQSFGAGLLLNQVFDLHGIKDQPVTYGENGKPLMADICFNISHSHQMVVCSLSRQPVGCDIERVRNVQEGMAERFFTQNEIQYLNQYDGENRQHEFFRIWTMKESYMKMTGEGMKLGLDSFEFQIGESVQVYRRGELCPCFVKEYELPGHLLTVCAEENEFSSLRILELSFRTGCSSGK